MSRWHVLNARDVQWWERRPVRLLRRLPTRRGFTEFGFNIGMAQPGQPSALYHREAHQECFLVLRGEALLIVEGEERPLKRWDSSTVPPASSTSSSVPATGRASCSPSAAGSARGDPSIP